MNEEIDEYYKIVISLDFYVDNNDLIVFKVYQKLELEQNLIEKLK